jgi:hypothetical protein
MCNVARQSGWFGNYSGKVTMELLLVRNHLRLLTKDLISDACATWGVS